jgi:mannitol/fructose-specific phosphotransferase system IIA component (Ntr-type)
MSYTLPQPYSILLDIDCNTREDLIVSLGGTLKDCPHVVNYEQFIRQLIRRERDTPTGLENGCAIPHARTAAVDEIVLAFGRAKSAVDFGAADGPAKLFFMFGVPEHCITQYLKLVAKLSAMLKQESFRQLLLDAKTERDVTEILSR